MTINMALEAPVVPCNDDLVVDIIKQIKEGVDTEQIQLRTQTEVHSLHLRSIKGRSSFARTQLNVPTGEVEIMRSILTKLTSGGTMTEDELYMLNKEKDRLTRGAASSIQGRRSAAQAVPSEGTLSRVQISRQPHSVASASDSISTTRNTPTGRMPY